MQAEIPQVDCIVFNAHPDDCEMAMGGTIIRLVDAGYKVLSVSLTPAQMSTHGTIESRRKEFERACRIMGCEGRILQFIDTEVENTPVARKEVARIIRQARPSILFAPYHTNPTTEYGGIANVDHYATGGIVRDAVKMARLERTVPDVPKHTVQQVYYYMLPPQVRPTVYIDVSAVVPRITEAIAAYESQMRIDVAGQSVIDFLMLQRMSAGTRIGAKYAEAFVVELPMIFSPELFFQALAVDKQKTTLTT